MPRKMWTAFLLSAITLTCWSQSKSQRANLQDIIDKVSSSTVLVKVEVTCQTHDASKPSQTDEKSINVTGTGFIADDDWHIVTASHVVDPDSPAFLAKLSAWLTSQKQTLVPGSIKITRITISAYAPNGKDDRENKTFDVKSEYGAILRKSDLQRDISVLFSINLFRRAHEGLRNIVMIDEGKVIELTKGSMETAQARTGDEVALAGFPTLYDIDGPRRWAAGTLVTFGKISNPNERNPAANDRAEILADVRAAEGNSGGPVFRQDTGKILGVAVAFNRLNGTLEIIPSADVKNLLATVPEELAP